ncbi:Xylose ABC transporter permease protein XylH CDS [Bradyrhizobium sp.]|nr:Xylose ABC transporter permease protein XylH CDS [Bradyrhizobium sp.]
MAMPLESPISFTNVGRIRWWQRGIFASQTGYVLLALAMLLVVMHFRQPLFLHRRQHAERGEEFLLHRHRHPRRHLRDHHRRHRSVGRLDDVLLRHDHLDGHDRAVAPGSPAGSLFVHMAADGKTVLANVPGLILLISILAGLGVALIAGLVNGFCIAVLGLSPFVTTLGMLSIVRGLGYVVSNGRGSFPGGPDADYFYALTSGDVLGVPVPFIYLVVLALAMAVVLHHSSFGRHVFALGGNEKAAELTGIPVVRVKIEVYVICALAAGLQGIIISGWLGSAPANMATSYELNVIAAAVIGGANLAGGIGGPLGAIVGCVLLEVIRNGLVLAQVSSYWQQTLVGVIIILAVLVDRIRSRMI